MRVATAAAIPMAASSAPNALKAFAGMIQIGAFIHSADCSVALATRLGHQMSDRMMK